MSEDSKEKDSPTASTSAPPPSAKSTQKPFQTFEHWVDTENPVEDALGLDDPVMQFERLKEAPGPERDSCLRNVRLVLQKSENVRHLLQVMRLISCPSTFAKMFYCVHCAEGMQGGFYSRSKQVFLCQNRLRDFRTYEHTLLHELIHSFDDCRAEVDWTDCQHQACSEIRAAHLSGDCGFYKEFTRGHVIPFGQHRDCVKRRATISVKSNPHCKQLGAIAVEKMMQQCIVDHEPFFKRP